MCAAFAGFHHFQIKDRHGYAAAEHFEALRNLLITREGATPVHGAGRGGVYTFRYPGGDGFLRVYRRGGAVRHFVRETYLFQNRALAEFKLLHELKAEGLAVPDLLGAVWTQLGPCYRGALATRALPGRDLLSALSSGEALSIAELQACGALVRRMHELRVYHPDLNAANLFLTPDGPVLLDFDKARRHSKALGIALCKENLDRLERSFRKHRLPESAFQALMSGY